MLISHSRQEGVRGVSLKILEEISLKKKRLQKYLQKKPEYSSLLAPSVAHLNVQQANDTDAVSQSCSMFLKPHDQSDRNNVCRRVVDVTTMCREYMPVFQNKHIINESNGPDQVLLDRVAILVAHEFTEFMTIASSGTH